jgi:hypothetical protein
VGDRECRERPVFDRVGEPEQAAGQFIVAGCLEAVEDVDIDARGEDSPSA